MEQDQPVKISVYLSEPIHHRLKMKSVKQKTSIQRMMAGFAEAAATEGTDASTPSEPIESLALVGSPRAGANDRIDAKTVRAWQNRLKNVLESGNRLAVLNCTASIEAMEALIKDSTKED